MEIELELKKTIELEIEIKHLYLDKIEVKSSFYETNMKIDFEVSQKLN